MLNDSFPKPREDDCGAVAVEWIASTAAALGLCLTLLATMGGEPAQDTGHSVYAVSGSG